MTDEFQQEIDGEMFDCVKAETLQLQLITDPNTPIFDIFSYFGMGEVDVGEHEVVIICIFRINVFGPFFVITHNFVDCAFLIRGVVVCAGEMIPMIFLSRIFLVAGSVVETEPAFYFVGIGQRFRAILGAADQQRAWD